MSQGAYLAIAISVIVALAAFVIVSFALLRKMPAPKGCEDIKPSEAKCGGCDQSGCPIYGRYHKEGDGQ